jgi:hypothetical protein
MIASIFFIGSVAPRAGRQGPRHTLFPPGLRRKQAAGLPATRITGMVPPDMAAGHARSPRLVLHGACHPGNGTGRGFWPGQHQKRSIRGQTA